jgi:hypothetical protein
MRQNVKHVVRGSIKMNPERHDVKTVLLAEP